MASVDVINQYDIPRLSSFLSVPHESLSHLATAASDYAVLILNSITARANEYDELKADKMRAEVELEQTVRTGGSKAKGLKTQLEAALKENQQLREKLCAEGKVPIFLASRDEVANSRVESARVSIEGQLSNMRSSRSNADDETGKLKARVQSLESDKRETLEALERKNKDYDHLQEEYQFVQSKVIESRTEIGRLESQLQQAQSIQTSTKFREQNLQQEIELLKKNNE